MPIAIGDSVAKHWRGHYDLLMTSACALLGIRLGLGAIQQNVLTMLTPVTLAAWLTFSLMVLIWQLVGGWRACENHVSDGGGMVTGWVGYGALLITLSLAVFQTLDGISAQVNIEPAPTPPPVQLQLRENNTVLAIDEPLDWPLFNAFKSSLSKHQTITSVWLDSEGGRVFTARAMARLVEQYELDTHVENRCYSACTVVFMAGEKRTANLGAELGFHQYALQQDYQLQQIDVSLELKQDRDYFVRRGVSADFANSVFKATPDALWKPNRKSLLDAGVLTN